MPLIGVSPDIVSNWSWDCRPRDSGATDGARERRADGAGRRQRFLESQRYIKSYSPGLDFARFGFSALVMMLIQPEKQALSMLEAFEQGVCGSQSILSCHLLSGSVDYLLSLRARY